MNSSAKQLPGWARVCTGDRFSLYSRQTAYNGTMRKTYPKRRADLMRRIAALHAKVTSGRYGRPAEPKSVEREELKRQIAALTQQMMAL